MIFNKISRIIFKDEEMIASVLVSAEGTFRAVPFLLTIKIVAVLPSDPRKTCTFQILVDFLLINIVRAGGSPFHFFIHFTIDDLKKLLRYWF